MVQAYTALNKGDTKTCTNGIWGSGKCSVDPMGLNNYMKKCQGVGKPCTALVVGLNLIAPTARDNDHLGVFIQEKNKDFIKHYKVMRGENMK
jgi:hypothetical protein